MKILDLYKAVGVILLAILTFPYECVAKSVEHSNLPEFKKLVEASIKQFEDTQRKNWSFKVVRYENEEGDITSSTEVFHPHTDSAKQWTLVELNGKKPTKKQLNKFIKRKRKTSQQKQSDSNNYSVKLREIIDINSLKISNENEAQVEMNFNVFLEKLGDDSNGKLNGALTFNKAQQYIDSITITNNAEFSPMFSATITDFSLTFKFTKINTAILPLENSLSMKGSFAFFTEIDETSHDSFSEYTYKAIDESSTTR